MLNRVMLSTLSLATLTCVITWPLSSNALMSPLSNHHRASVQLSNGFWDHDSFVEQPSDNLGGLMITGCSQMGTGGPQMCLQWLGDALTTCLEWGEDSVIKACMQKGNASEEGVEEDGYTTQSAGPQSSQSSQSSGGRTDWGFSVEFSLR